MVAVLSIMELMALATAFYPVKYGIVLPLFIFRGLSFLCACGGLGGKALSPSQAGTPQVGLGPYMKVKDSNAGFALRLLASFRSLGGDLS